MRKIFGMNRHQKAAHKVGERQAGKEQIQELLALSSSADAEDRLMAAENLCPCHVRTRIPAVWDALFRMMEDEDWRVRRAAWHTIEDGGKPSDDEGARRLEQILERESNPKVRKLAEATLNKVLGHRRSTDMAGLWIASKPIVRQRGKCDFCAAASTFVELEPSTLIPTGSDHRAALICETCSNSSRK